MRMRQWNSNLFKKQKSNQFSVTFQLTFTSSKSTMETPEQYVKYVQR